MLSPNDHQLIPLEPTNDLVPPQNYSVAFAGQVANDHAAQGVFVDYLSRKSDNTIRSQAASLTRFADYLDRIGEGIGQSFGADIAAFADAVAAFPDGLAPDPNAWEGISWGLVEGFRNWMVQEGDAISTINARLSAVKTYAKLARKAGALTPEEYAVTRTVAVIARRKPNGSTNGVRLRGAVTRKPSMSASTRSRRVS
jgi:hypothetical protein